MTGQIIPTHCDRRTLLRRSVSGGALLAAADFIGGGFMARSASAQVASLSSMTFIAKRPGSTTEEFRAWYEGHHAVDFSSFAKPYLARYVRNFVVKAHMGDAGFDVISEFAYSSMESQAAVQKILATPEAKQLLASHKMPGSGDRPPDTSGESRTFSVDERLLIGTARGHDKTPTAKQAILLKRKAGVSGDDLARALAVFGSAAMHRLEGSANRVVLDLAIPDGVTRPIFDGLVMIWPKKGTIPSKSFDIPSKQVDIVNIVDLEAHESPVGEA